MFKKPCVKKLVGATVLALAPITATWAAPVTVPVGLNPGDQYRLAFVTRGTGNALSTDINTYNTFVTNSANSVAELAALSTDWYMIGSTATVAAFDNTLTKTASTGVPIYLLDGSTKIADNNADLWDGTIDNPINIFEDGTNAGVRYYWHGGPANGIATPNWMLGGNGTGSAAGKTRAGRTDQVGPDPAGWTWYAGLSANQNFSYTAMSGVLTVPSPVPVPAAAWLFGSALFGLGLVKRRKA